MKTSIRSIFGACLMAALLGACAGVGNSVAPATGPGANAQHTSARHDSCPCFQLIYTFGATSGDGAQPAAGLEFQEGRFYGTTQLGGSANDGTVFSVTPTGTESVLHSFGGSPDGENPITHLATVELNGALYGVTYMGGSSGYGSVFRITRSGAETVLHSFAGGSDGIEPSVGLVELNGVLFGTTALGGGSGCRFDARCGTVFRITTGGTQRVLYTFAGGSDGSFPVGKLLALNGMLYGTTLDGGTDNVGTVFSVSTGGTETVLHTFTGGGDGGSPYDGLIARAATLYGTTNSGGAHGDGTVFSLTP